MGFAVYQHALRPVGENRPQSLSTLVYPIAKRRVDLLRQPTEGVFAQLQHQVNVLSAALGYVE